MSLFQSFAAIAAFALGFFVWTHILRRTVAARTSELRKSEASLRDANDDLERRVRERTEALSEVIVERKRAEKILRQQEERFRLVLDNALVGIITIDERGFVQSINPSAEEIFGYSGEEIVGENVSLLMPEPDKGKHGKYLEKYLETGEGGIIGVGHEVEGLRKDGTVFPLALAISKLRLNSKRLFTGIVRDITDHKKAQLDILVAKQEAEAANVTKSEFLASMSHELRTPLTAIIGFSNTIQQEVFGPLGHSKYNEYIDDIHASGIHLLELINDILDVSVIEAGKLELHEERLKVGDIVATSVRLVNPRAEKRAVRITVTEQDPLPGLFADKRRMKQILLNLLSNAVKFTPQGGEIFLDVRIDGGGSMVFAVSDTGIGMNEEEIAKAMSPFGQVDSSLAGKFEGTGLGLPLTKSLAEHHGGVFEIASAKGEGTTVTIRFPQERVIGDGRSKAPNTPHIRLVS